MTDQKDERVESRKTKESSLERRKRRFKKDKKEARRGKRIVKILETKLTLAFVKTERMRLLVVSFEEVPGRRQIPRVSEKGSAKDNSNESVQRLTNDLYILQLSLYH